MTRLLVGLVVALAAVPATPARTNAQVARRGDLVGTWRGTGTWDSAGTDTVQARRAMPFGVEFILTVLPDGIWELALADSAVVDSASRRLYYKAINALGARWRFDEAAGLLQVSVARIYPVNQSRLIEPHHYCVQVDSAELTLYRATGGADHPGCQDAFADPAGKAWWFRRVAAARP